MTETRYLQPHSLDELKGCLGEMTRNSVILAGGTDIMVEIRSRHPEIDRYLSLCKVDEMKGIKREGDWIRIGAMETHEVISENTLIQDYFPALSMSCAHVGSKQIRNKGTIGGSLANASVAGDMLPCVSLFHGSLEILKDNGETYRMEPEDFIKGVGRNSLTPQEVLYAVWLPVQEERHSCFVKLGPRAEVTIAEISLALSWQSGEQGFYNIEAILGAVDTKPIRLEEAAEILAGCRIGKQEKEKLTNCLSQRIRTIRENRKRQPKLRILECEKVYKEHAVRSIVYDAVEKMEEQAQK